MDSKRLILFVIFSFSILMLWESWQREHMPAQQPVAQQQASETEIPQPARKAAAPAQDASVTASGGERIKVKTDLIYAEIDTMGGDLRRIELLKHGADGDKTKNFVLLDDSQSPALYVAQSGLIGHGLPTHKTLYTSSATDYALKQGTDSLEVVLTWSNDAGVRVRKVYTFRRGSYVVDVRHDLHNGGSETLTPAVYYQIVHDSKSNQSSYMMPTFTGAAYYTEAEKYKKIKFEEMGKSNLSVTANDGWIGMVQHYFVSAWLPATGESREYYTKHLGGDNYSMGAVSAMPALAPGADGSVQARFYAGPQEQAHLEQVAPGLEYTVDYGWLTVIASPLFWVLAQIQKLVGNWGVAIILLTVLIKLAFYPLSAASYKSMAHMREIAPRLQRIKEQYGDDRQKLHQAMMEIYQKEKINPMGGCLPILIQIPVFIALYWVLLGSVEMRQAPFALWIQDLTATDPYYVLPILMGATMIIQTKLNPTPPDPIQAKVMMIMPIVFSVFFFFFPAGLVLYWLVNNVLSIAQQWYINRTFSSQKKGNAKA